MIVGLDVRISAEIECAFQELRIEQEEDIIKIFYDYFKGIYNYKIEKYYFENESIFIHYKQLDSYFINKYKEYKKSKINTLKLIVNN